MSDKKYRGPEWRDEIESKHLRFDTRTLTRKARDFFEQTDGVIAASFAFPILGLLLVKVPLSGEALAFLMFVFYQFYVKQGVDKEILEKEKIEVPIKRFDFPFRVPFMAKLLDGSYADKKLGDGITFLGKEISSKLEIWTGNSDLRTHMLVLGTTGSGKTEFLLGLVYNALIQNSGFIYTDGKGDVALFNNVFRLARYLGREDDLVTINFLTSGRDFLDKQKDRTTNTMNPFALGSSGMLIELIISLMDDSGGGGDMWKGRAIAFVSGQTRALCFLRDRGYLLLDSNTFIQYFELPVIEKMVWDKTITVDGADIKIEDPLFEKVLEPMKAYLLTLPGYKREAKGAQEQKTVEQHGYITMQLTRLFGDMSFTYGYLFQTSLGEVDMYDVVINRRILVVLLPALERAPDSLKMLGKLIVGAIKQMMAGCLGNRLEGSVREIVDARPTNAAVPFYVVLDEYGYYAVLGFAVAPAQARSLGFPQPLSALVRMADGTRKRMGEMQAGDMIRLPTNAAARVEEVLEHGLLPCSRLVLESGRTVEAANVHHWPVRKVYQQNLLMTTQEIKIEIENGWVIEVAMLKDGKTVWEEVTAVEPTGVQEVRCLVVGDPLHCYLTDHDIVTHNCIVFAAQDFSSLQKASKEEADATWENTNVRVVGRITSGEESETYRRVKGVAGETTVQQGGGKEFRTGDLGGSYVTVRDTRPERVRRLEYDDMAQQENGEFTFLIGKKSSGGRGGVRVIRARTFYTQVKERPTQIRVNHFLKVEPPRAGSIDQELEVIDALESALKELIESGKLAKTFPNDPLALAGNRQPVTLLQAATYIHEAQEQHRLSLSDAVRLALVCAEKEVEVQQAAKLKELEQMKQAAGSPEAELPGSIEVVIDAPVAAESQSAQPVKSGGMGGYLDDDEVDGKDGKKDTGTQSGDAAGTGTADGGKDGKGDKGDQKGGSKGGSGTAAAGLMLKPVAAPEASKPVSVATEIADFLDGYAEQSEGDGESSSGGQSAGTQSAGAGEKMQVSVLTLRPIGEGEEPTEISSYIENKIADADVLIGAKQNVLEIKADAKEEVRHIEKATAYIDGTVPEPATLENFDDIIDGLKDAAERNMGMFD